MIDALQSGWVLSWKNIITEQYVGDSHGYACDQTAVGTTNGAGGRNVQLFMLAPDGTVLHVLPGFWHPEDLLAELAFAEQLLALWQDPTLPVWIKRQAAALAQQGHAAAHDHDTQARSRWQGFDAKNELKRYEQLGDRDTLLDIVSEGSRKAREHARETLEAVRTAMGFDYRKVLEKVAP